MNRTKQMLLAVWAAAAGSLGVAEVAQATYVYDDASASVPLYAAPNTGTNVLEYMPNNERIELHCWLDNDGHRWFDATAFDTGTHGFVTAGPVREQTDVPSCDAYYGP